MGLRPHTTHTEIIEQIIQFAYQEQPATSAHILERFIRQYYHNVPADDLLSKNVQDLYSAVIAHWRLLASRLPEEAKVRIYNPAPETEGWQSSHTVIEVAQEDMPFLVDSLTMELNRLGLNIHLVIHSGGLRVVRDEDHQVIDFLAPTAKPHSHEKPEAVIYFEIDRQPEEPVLFENLRLTLLAVLKDVAAAVRDFQPMKQKLTSLVTILQQTTPRIDPNELQECVDFLEWLNKDHFTFLGFTEFAIEENKGRVSFKQKPATSLGVLRGEQAYPCDSFFAEFEKAKEAVFSAYPLLITKSDYKATVHRASYMDVVSIKKFDTEGRVKGEHRFMGLFTSTAYHSSPRFIPLLRRKLEVVMQRANFPQKGHAAKTLLNVLETFPRDELFQIDNDELFQMAIGILQLQERQKLRLFIRKDTYGRYFTCLVFVPRDLFNTELRLKLQNILMAELKGISATSTPNFLESVLCRIDFVIHTHPKEAPTAYDLKAIETKLAQAARNWNEDLKYTLLQQQGEHKAYRLFEKYAHAFPAGYREAFSVESAAVDITHIEAVCNGETLGKYLYYAPHEPAHPIRFKLFQKGKAIELSTTLPILENMGLRVIEERPYKIHLPGTNIWISDFGMQYTDSSASTIESEIFQEAFTAVSTGLAENDGFNKLVVKAGIPWREIGILRAYAKYLLQTGFRHSQSYMEDALSEYPAVTKKLLEFFKLRFTQKPEESAVRKLHGEIKKLLEGVSNIDKDRILRRFMEVIKATLRTNYFQKDSEGQYKNYISFKLAPRLISEMPQPLPMFEIFVYSPRVEGVHLRGAKVARGGLRWSDRREDFRTEVLGLMKAQQVKNAVIVPLGAKGGFVPKALPSGGDREAILAEATACYKIFIRGLLDLTDNLIKGKVIPPQEVVRYDEDDPYLVVAADKGTATFSDIANSVALEYNFWLGDAFASGGSYGYDHKKMGITARGAWESVKRHFLEFGKDIQSEDFTVVGIGDMSGDVFGNGMLQSQHIRLIAAFNHMHIFLDPNPDAKTSFKERKRLFTLPRSTWADYNPKLISTGGGVYLRSAKTIPLSPEVQRAFGLDTPEIDPNQLIQTILTAKVDLLWNGGIGTYVKSSQEHHSEVGDRTNDQVRVNAADLNCKVVGEGGNLGFTQLARIEFALKSGEIYTDAIDNSAGVDCSDHEVNIKILLNDALVKGELSLVERNELLITMQDEVAQLVLRNNYQQTQAINNALAQSLNSSELYIRLMRELERQNHLNRAIEFLPSDKNLKARRSNGQGLTAPELAILMAYSKTVIKRAILQSSVPEDPYFSRFLEAEFPKILAERFGDIMQKHQLHREIIATQLTNALIVHAGITFIHRMHDETGATPSIIAKAYAIAMEVLNVEKLWHEIEALDGVVPAKIQRHMMLKISETIERFCRWLLRNRRSGLVIAEMIQDMKPKLHSLQKQLHSLLSAEEKELHGQHYQHYYSAGVPKKLSKSIADLFFMSPALDILTVTEKQSAPLEYVAKIYFKIGQELSFGWFRENVLRFNEEGYWEMLSTAALRDDLDKLQRSLTVSVLQQAQTTPDHSPREAVHEWIESYRHLVDRWLFMLEDVKTNPQSFARYLASLRAVSDLAQAATHGAPHYQHREVLLSV